MWAVVFADESRAEPLPPPQQGVHVSSTVNVVAQAVPGRVAHDELSASGDVFIDVPVGPFSVHVYLEAGSTPKDGGVFARLPEANTDAGTALAADGHGRIQLSEFRLGWEVWEGSQSMSV